MPIFERRGLRRRHGRALALAATVLTGSVLAAPSPASAGEDWFCSGVWLESTQQCRAPWQRWLGSVQTAVSGYAYHRICAGSATSMYGGNNSEWRCDYGTASRVYYGSVYGVGAVRNGAPYGFTVGLSIQYW
jgi:hypothetical protein